MSRAIFLSLATAFGVGRTLVLLGGTPTPFPDTGSYLRAISFVGRSFRPWGTPILYAVLPTDTARVVGQWSIATVAWAVLALAVWRMMGTLAAKAVGAGLVILLALSTAVTNWDFALLSESLSISLGVLCLGAFLLWRVTGATLALVVLVASAVWWSFSRYEVVLMLAVLAAGIAWIWWRERSRKALLGLGVLTVALGWSAVASSINDDFARHPYSAGGSVSEELVVYRLGRQVYRQPVVEKVFVQRLGLPPCPGLAAQARVKWDIRKIPAEYKRCPEVIAWAKENSAAGLRFALAAPVEYARVTYPLIDVMYSGEGAYGKVPRLLPEHLMFADRGRALWHTWGALVVLGLAALATARRHPMFAPAIALAAISVIAQLATTLYAVHELVRMGIQETIASRIAIALLLAVIIDGLLRRRRRAVPTSND